MSKRVGNKKGGGGARSGRIRIGFHRQRRITNVERAMEAHRKKTVMGSYMDKEAKQASKDAVKALQDVLLKLIPKRSEHRGVR